MCRLYKIATTIRARLEGTLVSINIILLTMYLWNMLPMWDWLHYLLFTSKPGSLIYYWWSPCERFVEAVSIVHNYHGPRDKATIEWTKEDDQIVSHQRVRAQLAVEATVRKDSFFDLTNKKKPVSKFLRLQLV